MAISESRPYTLYVGQLGDAIAPYRTLGWPALKKVEDYLVGYFTGDVGGLNQIVHLWKFEDEAARREFWAAVYDDAGFKEFAGKFRPLIQTQENKFLLGAPWGPNP